MSHYVNDPSYSLLQQLLLLSFFFLLFYYFLSLNIGIYIVTDLINTLPGNGSLNTVQHAAIEQAVAK
jgi:hypothetical protein